MRRKKDTSAVGFILRLSGTGVLWGISHYLCCKLLSSGECHCMPLLPLKGVVTERALLSKFSPSPLPEGF